MLSKQKGDMALGKAISHFLANGYEVCLPIGDKRDYDLVIEKQGKLERVQVKYGGLYKNKTRCQVALRVMGAATNHTLKLKSTMPTPSNTCLYLLPKVKATFYPGTML